MKKLYLFLALAFFDCGMNFLPPGQGFSKVSFLAFSSIFLSYAFFKINER